MSLVEAAESGNFVEVKNLLDSGTNINMQDKYGSTALMWAAREGLTEIVELLLGNGAKIDMQDTDGKTALMWAAVWGRTETVELLLDKGANPDIKDNNDKTAFDLAKNDEIKNLLNPNPLGNLVGVTIVEKDAIQNDKCAICQDPLKGVVVKPNGCEHQFHAGCLSKWAEKSRTCPLCRKVFFGKSKRRRSKSKKRRSMRRRSKSKKRRSMRRRSKRRSKALAPNQSG